MGRERAEGQGTRDGAAAPKLTAALVSVGVNVSLIAVEGTIAILTGSLAVLADAGHSVVDLVASGFAYWGIRVAASPPDPTHHYGHEKFENLSSLIQVGLLLVTVLFILYEATDRLVSGYSPSVGPVHIAVIAATLVVDLAVARYLARVASTYGSYALQADALHFMSDLWGKMAVLAGLAGAMAGLGRVDSIAALMVALAMAMAAWRLGRAAGGVLVDTAPSAYLEERVRQVLRDEVGESYHSLRMRQAGNRLFLDLSLHVAPELSVAEAHDRAERLCRRLWQEIEDVEDVVVHVEPADDRHDEEQARYRRRRSP